MIFFSIIKPIFQSSPALLHFPPATHKPNDMMDVTRLAAVLFIESSHSVQRRSDMKSFQSSYVAENHERNGNIKFMSTSSSSSFSSCAVQFISSSFTGFLFLKPFHSSTDEV